jgi:SAM-dependent methyltransferase
MDRPILYTRLAPWWPLLSSPEEYAEEAGFYSQAILSHCEPPPQTLLELGSGGGNNAAHLKRRFRMTLVDLSPRMLRVSRALNPECVHLRGDMRSVRLARLFDAVFIQDAVSYMANRTDLARAVATAHAHCRPGGAALFAPDFTAECFQATTAHGGHDRGDRGLRYLEWTIDEDPADERYSVYMVYALRRGSRLQARGPDRHVCGLFPDSVWLKLIEQAGFRAERLPFRHSDFAGEERSVFVGVKPRA